MRRIGIGTVSAVVLVAMLALFFGSAGAGPTRVDHEPSPSLRARLTIVPDKSQLRRAVETGQWAGYLETPGRVDSVSGTWSVPRLHCSRIETLSSTWAGAGGLTGGPLLQAGMYDNCIGGFHVNGAFAEEYPGPTISFQFLVRPGDVVTATVAHSQRGWVAEVIDMTTGQKGLWLARGYPGAASAEWMAEAYGAPGGVPITNFGSERLRSLSVNGQPARISGVWRMRNVVASNPASGVLRLRYVPGG